MKVRIMGIIYVYFSMMSMFSLHLQILVQGACFFSSSYTIVWYCTTFVPAIVCLFIYSSKKIVK